MSEHSKVFTYEVEGLSYTVTVYEDEDNPGKFLADITVTEGAMDVNAIYFGDDDYSGSSESLSGPLNMNGAQLDGEKVQWDEATKLSDPGLGPDGTDKETYLEADDTLTVSLDIESLEEIDIFGIRATSTTTEEGSIKGVTGDPEEPDPEDPTYEKVFFGNQFSETGFPESGTFITDEELDPNEWGVPSLPEDTEPTFENYLSYFLSDLNGDLGAVESVVFYETNEDGNPEELFRIDAPEGGFQSEDELLAAYDDAIDDSSGATSESFAGQDLIASLSLGDSAEAEAEADEDDPMEEEDFDLA